MNPREAAELLGHCSAFDNRKPSAAAAVAWAAALPDVPLDPDAKSAVASYYTTAPKDPDAKLWIMPHHVRTLRSKLRSARLENFQYEPITGESPLEYLARYRGQVQAIASGRVAGPTGRPELTGGPNLEVARMLEGVGRSVPDSDEEALLESVRRSGPLGIECPQCSAAIGRPCKTPGGSSRQPMGRPRMNPHSVRVDAAQGRPVAGPAERKLEEDRARAASAAALARMEAAGEIPDAEIVEDAS